MQDDIADGVVIEGAKILRKIELPLTLDGAGAFKRRVSLAFEFQLKHAGVQVGGAGGDEDAPGCRNGHKSVIVGAGFFANLASEQLQGGAHVGVVTPQETGNWSWDKLVGILNDTLLRAKLRAIDPGLLDTQTKPELGVLLPAILSTYSQQGLDISLDYRNNIKFYAENLQLTALG